MVNEYCRIQVSLMKPVICATSPGTGDTSWLTATSSRMSTKYANVSPEFSKRHNKLGRTSSKTVDACANFFKWNHQLGHKSSKRTHHRWLIIATDKMLGAPQVGPDTSQEVSQKMRQASLSSLLARCQAPLCITSGLFAKAMILDHTRTCDR